MNFFIFASFIVFGCWLTYQLQKSRKLDQKAISDFWEHENLANSVRKKQLTESDYVQFPFDRLPSDQSFSEPIPESLTVLRTLSDKKMINLNGLSNTEVKLKYGTANITTLSEYDENFASFVKHIYLLCQHLYDNGRSKEARELLEEGIRVGTDSLSHYRLLAQIYRENGELHKLSELKPHAEQLHSLTKGAILRVLSD